MFVMTKVEIFDPAMCCSTGVCGPGVDPELTRIAASVHALEKKGVNIQRYQLTNAPDKFADNKEVNQILVEKGPDALPVVLVNDVVESVGSYPSNHTLASWFDVDIEALSKKPTTRKSIDLSQL